MLHLDVHPLRPHLCASGAGGGCVALWDLRFINAPLALTPPQPELAGCTWEVRAGLTLYVYQGGVFCVPW